MHPRVVSVAICSLVFSIGCTSAGLFSTQKASRRERAQAPPQQVEVEIAVTGVAHLVGSQADQRLLILPNLTASDHGPVHEPLLLASTKFHPQGLNEKPTFQSSSSTKFAWRRLLRGVEIDLASSGVVIPTVSDLSLVEETDPTARCPSETGEPEASMHWIPELAIVGGIGTVTIADAALTTDTPTAGDVAVRMKLVTGRLEADLSASPYVVRFDDGDPATMDREQAVAQFLAYKFVANVPQGEPFTLYGKEFGTGYSVFLGSFMPQNGRVRIILANIPPELFFNPPSTGTISHFHEYYRIYGEGVHPAFQPVPAGRCGTSISEVIDCGPGRVAVGGGTR